MSPRRTSISAFTVLVFLLCLYSCGTGKKVQHLIDTQASAELTLPYESEFAGLDTVAIAGISSNDTLSVLDDEGNKIFLMRTILDENGEATASEMLEAAYISARFRNVAERRGKVDIRFDVTVPAAMIGSSWQVRLTPTMFIMGDSTRLDPVVITGKDFRSSQIRGYERYEQWVSKIVEDTTRFINRRQIELFIERYMPEVYAFRNDTSIITEDEFNLAKGITGEELIEHYTDDIARRINKRRIASKDKRFQYYVKTPIVEEGLKLDTIITTSTGDLVYEYVQTIEVHRGLRKADIVMDGGIFEFGEKQVYTVPRSKPLAFYISSLSSFVDTTTHYKTKVIERRAEANSSYNVVFKTASYKIDPTLENNAEEIARIKKNILDLVENQVFDLDSIIISAFASPEGNWKYNMELSTRRSASISSYMTDYMQRQRDSIIAERGFFIDAEEGTVRDASGDLAAVRFTSRSDGENWRMLDELVRNDTYMVENGYDEEYFKLADMHDLDRRERRMSRHEWYSYVRDVFYPKLRVVNFNFHLHRKGMVKDTIHTTVVDTTYMEGVQAIDDRDYERAIALLTPYHDYNLAVAYSAMDRTESALEILEKYPESKRTAPINYMLAILYSRKGEIQKAIQLYMNSCSQNPSYVYRGNLDPEISALIKQYGLNKQNDDEDW